MTRFSSIPGAATLVRFVIWGSLAAALAGCAGLATGAGADAERAAKRFDNELTGGGIAGPGLADELAQRDDLKTAAALYALRAQQAPTAAERSAAYEKLGDVLMRADRPRQAAGSFRMALRETPGRSSAYAGLGIALMMGGEPEFAISQLESIEGTKGVGVLATLGVAYSTLGQYDKALSAYDRGLTISPFDKILLSNRALTSALAGDMARAYTDARTVADDPFASPTQQRNLPLILAIGGDSARARSEGAALRLPSADVEQVIQVGSRISQASGEQRNQLVLALAGR